jgi:hypothetical protein
VFARFNCKQLNVDNRMVLFLVIVEKLPTLYLEKMVEVPEYLFCKNGIYSSVV